MKFTVDIDKPLTLENISNWQNSHYAIIQMLAEKGIFYEVRGNYEVDRNAHGHFHVDFDFPFEFTTKDTDKDILLMRLALGDDIRRLRMDAVRYFLNIKIDQVIE